MGGHGKETSSLLERLPILGGEKERERKREERERKREERERKREREKERRERKKERERKRVGGLSLSFLFPQPWKKLSSSLHHPTS